MVVWLILEATDRMLYHNDFEINAQIMLITAIISLACNCFSLFALDHLPFCKRNPDEESVLHKINSVYMPHGGCSHDHHHDNEHSGSSHSAHSHSHHDHDHHHHEELSSTNSTDGEVKPEKADCDHEHEHSHGHSHDEEENINIRAAVVHVIGDMLQSIGVIMAALIIMYYPKYKVADPICTYIFSILVMFTTIPVFRDCIGILMEQQPKGINTEKMKHNLL